MLYVFDMFFDLTFVLIDVVVVEVFFILNVVLKSVNPDIVPSAK